MFSKQILAGILDCGYLDLQILEDTEFDVVEMIKEMEKPTLSDLIYEIFQRGIDLLMEKLSEKQNNLDCPDEIKELSIEDIDFDINFIASRIYFVNNSDIWNKYFGSEIEEIEKKMGFCFA